MLDSVGTVLIIGRPNVGKSLLFNKLISFPLSIVSDKKGTTRDLITGLYNDHDSEILFLDTPGVSKTYNHLMQNINKVSLNYIDEADVILFVIDLKRGIIKEDKELLKSLDKNKKVFLIMNKIDGLKKELVYSSISYFQSLFSFQEIIPVSAKTGFNVKEIINTLKKYLPQGYKRYEENLTFNSLNFLISEIVREGINHYIYEELPDEISTKTLSYDKNKNYLKVEIIIKRESIKKILIGKNGEKIKKIKKYAKERLRDLLGSDLNLELVIQTDKNYQENYLKERRDIS